MLRTGSWKGERDRVMLLQLDKDVETSGGWGSLTSV